MSGPDHQYPDLQDAHEFSVIEYKSAISSSAFGVQILWKRGGDFVIPMYSRKEAEFFRDGFTKTFIQ